MVTAYPNTQEYLTMLREAMDISRERDSGPQQMAMDSRNDEVVLARHHLLDRLDAATLGLHDDLETKGKGPQ